MHRKPHPVRRTTTVAVSALLLSAGLPLAPIAADAPPDDPGPGAGSDARGSGPAVYVLDGRVVAIRREPLPPGAYGGHGVDYAPDMTAWVLGPTCGR